MCICRFYDCTAPPKNNWNVDFSHRSQMACNNLFNILNNLVGVMFLFILVLVGHLESKQAVPFRLLRATYCLWHFHRFAQMYSSYLPVLTMLFIISNRTIVFKCLIYFNMVLVWPALSHVCFCKLCIIHIFMVCGYSYMSCTVVFICLFLWSYFIWFINYWCFRICFGMP